MNPRTGPKNGRGWRVALYLVAALVALINGFFAVLIALTVLGDTPEEAVPPEPGAGVSRQN